MDKFFIGRKGVLVYVGIIIATTKPNKDVLIKARGKAINKAVDVALITDSKLKQLEVKTVKISKTKTKNRKNEDISLSEIEIRLGES